MLQKKFRDIKEGKTYKIPANAKKPVDGRVKQGKYISPKATERYLKWDDDIIGTIDSANAVEFVVPDYDEVVSLYTRGMTNNSSTNFCLNVSSAAIAEILSGFYSVAVCRITMFYKSQKSPEVFIRKIYCGLHTVKTKN